MNLPTIISLSCMAVVLLFIDLAVGGKSSKRMSARVAAKWSTVWFLVAIIFAGWLWLSVSAEHAGIYLTCFLVEKSLSLDNLLIFTIIFSTLKIDERHQERVLRIGIIGALLLRFLMIFAGIQLIERFEWLNYVLGAVLLLTGIKILIKKDDKPFDKTWLWKIVNNLIPSTTHFHGQSFWFKEKGRHKATPILIALIIILLADVIFAVDSVPAVFALTHKLDIIYLANFFSILGLRPLYYLLLEGLDRFEYLQFGLGLILTLMGIKMLFGFHLPAYVSLVVTVVVMTSCILLPKKRG